ncbi:MAG TPA: hypothetical protein DCF68_14785 [Cyanothece sp. UBA12306]|nr:hypothetical protein [Cyanothece sp. UBA12306]
MLGVRGKKKSPKNKKTDSSKDLKQRLIEKRKAKEARQKLAKQITLSIFLAIMIGIPLGLGFGLKAGLGTAVAIPTLILSYHYPRKAIWIFLIYMPFSGTLTYWIGGGNALFQISKDAFYIPALLGLIQECRREKKPIFAVKQLVPTFFLIVVWALLVLFLVNGMQQFIPECSSLSEYERFLRDANGEFILRDGIVITTPCKDGIPFLQGVVGFKVLLGYVPLMFCAYYFIEDKQKLLTLGRVLVTIVIICCVLGLAQYWFLKTGRCAGTDHLSGVELFKPRLEAKCLVGGSLLYSPSQGQIRLPGTFVSPWHWAWFLVASAAICFNTAFSDNKLFWRNCGLIGMGLVFINAVICGQRLAFAAVPGIILVLTILTGQIANFKRFISLSLGLALVLSIGLSFFNPDFIQERVDSFVNRWNTAPPQQFIEKQFTFSIENQRSLLGRGLGKGTNSSRTFGETALIETYHPKLLFEIGYMGLILFMLFVTHLIILSFKEYRSLKDPILSRFASGFWVFTLIIPYMPYWYPLDTDPVSVYYWFFAGTIFKLSLIDQQEQKKLKEERKAAKANKKRLKKIRIKPSTV